jgi:hypothetical protein
MSGVAIIIALLNMVFFGLYGEMSFESWYTLYGILFLTYGMVGTFQILAVRPPDPTSVLAGAAAFFYSRFSLNCFSRNIKMAKVVPQPK